MRKIVKRWGLGRGRGRGGFERGWERLLERGEECMCYGVWDTSLGWELIPRRKAC